MNASNNLTAELNFTSTESDTAMPSTIKLHRIFAAPPEKIYRAFTDPQAKASFMPPYGFYATVLEDDPKVGGKHRMSFTNFTTGNSHSFGGEYLELKPNELIRLTDRFDDENLPGEMTVTVGIKAVSVGSEVNITQEGVPDVIPWDGCYLGWRESLEKLAKLVEPNIPEG